MAVGARRIMTPILHPQGPLEGKGAFNPGACVLEDKVYMFYRAVGRDNVSRVMLAVSKDGISFERAGPVLSPTVKRHDYAGYEDPRVVIDGGTLRLFCSFFYGRRVNPVGTTYIQYQVMASCPVDDFLSGEYKWDVRRVSPPSYQGMVKGTTAIPPGWVFWRPFPDIAVMRVDSLDCLGRSTYLSNGWRIPAGEGWRKINVGGAVDAGDRYLMFISEVPERARRYCIGLLELDRERPYEVLRRHDFLLVPNASEWCLYPCGAVRFGGDIFVYFGVDDWYCGGARVFIE